MSAKYSGAMLDATTSHISVCICTYKRPHLLRRLLDELAGQDTGGQFTYSIVVVDNDQLRSAESVALDFAVRCPIPVKYCVESRQNISLARNKAVENATGDFIAFIDDDEYPTRSWLRTLFKTLNERNVDGVLGPVKPDFEQGAPEWVVKGKFYDRPTYPTGLVIDRQKGRTGNVLLKRRIFAADEPPFRPEFRTGEDQDFFGRMIQKGHVFIWCDEAVAYEVVPAIRWKRGFMLRRALLQGSSSFLNRDRRGFYIAKSIICVPVYTASLPFALLLGHHRFMTLLVKLFDHVGKLLAVMGINAVKEEYVTE
jgi:glycosyltransferase involved in cell wall biosynthesis